MHLEMRRGAGDSKADIGMHRESGLATDSSAECNTMSNPAKTSWRSGMTSTEREQLRNPQPLADVGPRPASERGLSLMASATYRQPRRP